MKLKLATAEHKLTGTQQKEAHTVTPLYNMQYIIPEAKVSVKESHVRV